MNDGAQVVHVLLGRDQWRRLKARAALEERPMLQILNQLADEYLAKHARVDGTGIKAQNGEKRRAAVV